MKKDNSNVRWNKMQKQQKINREYRLTWYDRMGYYIREPKAFLFDLFDFANFLDNKNEKKGFVLMELVVCFAIVAILTALGIPIYNHIMNAGKGALQQAIELSAGQ